MASLHGTIVWEKEEEVVAKGSTAEPKPTYWEAETSPSSGSNHKPLITYHDVPDWYQDNSFIHTGYRPVSNCTRASLLSWFYIHNESVNIYSHLIPSIAFLLGIWYILQYLHTRYTYITPGDDGIFVFFLLTAAMCLGLSTTYHTLLNHSAKVERIWLRMDFVGIVLLTLGDLVSGVYMIFWCETVQRKLYWGLIAGLGTVTIFILVCPWFQGMKWRIFRTMTFVATGLSGVAPLVHGICMFGWRQMIKQSGLPYYLAEGGLLILGAVVYATRFPEALWPGKFDIYGSSHQLFHILVVMATTVQLVGILEAYNYNYHNRTCMAP